jgi:hypothetical protein
MAMNISRMGQAADLATAGLEDARAAHIAILRGLSKARTIANYDTMLAEIKRIQLMIDATDGYSVEVTSNPIIKQLRANINKAMIPVETRLKALEAQRTRHIREAAAAEGAAAEAALKQPDAKTPAAETKIPWVPIAIGAGALALAFGIGG